MMMMMIMIMIIISRGSMATKKRMMRTGLNYVLTLIYSRHQSSHNLGEKGILGEWQRTNFWGAAAHPNPCGYAPVSQTTQT